MINVLSSVSPFERALVLLDILFSLVIILRVLTFQRADCHHSFIGGFLAWLVVVVYAWDPVHLAFGSLVRIEWTQVVVNGVVMLAVLKLRGNVMQLFKIATRQTQ